MLKKFLICLLIVAMVIATFAACNNGSSSSEQETTDQKDRVILKTEIIDGNLWITYSDDPENPINAGRVETDSSINESSISALAFYLLSDGTYGVTAGEITHFEEINIPEKYNGKAVTHIFPKAFENVTNIKSITIPNSVKSIGSYAFSGCTNLANITIPNSIIQIDSWAFFGCSSLKNVYITDIAKWCAIGFADVYSTPFSYAKNLYLNNNLITDLVIPDGVTRIGAYTFRNCSSLTSVTISEGVTDIGTEAFYNCTSLTRVTIPNSVTSIGEYSFRNCTSLPSITIPENVKSIGCIAFRGCSSLTHVTFENTSNWKAGGTSISQSDLSNPVTAANYLKSTSYNSYYWNNN